MSTPAVGHPEAKCLEGFCSAAAWWVRGYFCLRPEGKPISDLWLFSQTANAASPVTVALLGKRVSAGPSPGSWTRPRFRSLCRCRCH